ncbi:hypothetical protein Pelo_8733 [Pelomyxa schiedti]|nr:hypothetical protein Pelo_8733 [Pelomyxa schiedti]
MVVEPQLPGGDTSANAHKGSTSEPQEPTAMKCPICGDALMKATNEVIAALLDSKSTSSCTGSFGQQQPFAEDADSCPLCDDQATHSCSLCGSIVCEKPQCVRAVTRQHSRMGHLFTPIEIKSAKTIIQCPEHNSPIKLFCTQDNTPVCSMCVLSGCHQDPSLKTVHPTITISEAAKGRQVIITEKSKELEEKVKSMKGSLLAIRSCSEALKAMDEEFLRLETLLQKRHKQLAVECMNIADSTEKIMDIQHDHLEKFVFIAEAALKSASKLSHTSHDFGVIRSFDSTSRVISDLVSQLIHLKPCCRSELNFVVTNSVSEAINSFGALTFGVSTTLSKFKVTPCGDVDAKTHQGTLIIAGNEWKCTVECTSLVDATGTPIPSSLQVPSLTSAGLTVVGPHQDDVNQRCCRIVNQGWKNDGKMPPKCEVSFIPKRGGRHSLLIGGDTEIFSFVAAEINANKTRISGCLNGTVGKPFKIHLTVNLSDGTIIPTDDDTRRSSSSCVGVLTSQVIQTRFRVVSSDADDGAIDSTACDGSAKFHNFTRCDRPDEVEFTLQHGGKYHLIVEAAVWPNMESWVPIPGCPFLVTVTQVDISKSKIENLQQSPLLLLGQRLSLPIKLMNTGGQPVADVDVEWRVSVTPPTAAIVSIGGSSGPVVVEVEPKVVMDNVVLGVEGSFSSPQAASQAGGVVEKDCSSNHNNKEKVWQHISGSPFALNFRVPPPPQARKIGSVLASSTDPGLPPERVIDYSHDHDTFWLCRQNNTTGQFLVFDLTEPCVVPVVCFRTHNDAASPKDVTVSVGDSSTGPWTTLSTFTAQKINDWQRFPVTINASTTPHRWVRLFFDSNHGSTGYVVVSGVKFWD